MRRRVIYRRVRWLDAVAGIAGPFATPFIDAVGVGRSAEVVAAPVAIGGGLRPCWPSDSRAWSSTADGSGCVARDRTVGDSSGTYVVGNSLACKPESDRLATRTTSRIKRRRPKGRRSEQRRKKTVALEPGKKTHAKNSNFGSAESERFQLGGGSIEWHEGRPRHPAPIRIEKSHVGPCYRSCQPCKAPNLSIWVAGFAACGRYT